MANSVAERLPLHCSRSNTPGTIGSTVSQVMPVKPLIVIQLNEVNFDVVRHYAGKYDDLPAFKTLLNDFRALETFGEQRYEELEPWIQWVSAQTGKTYAEHGVFRLGDVVNTPDSLLQIFEVLESQGLRVGAISPMNARNRLQRPAYFVPDPWTDTPPDGSGFSQRLTGMLRQTVNDNASGRITKRSLSTLAEAVLRSFHHRGTTDLLRLILGTRRKPWTKSLILDQLLHLVHRSLWWRTRPDVSFVFLNAGAHIQHHYFFNAEIERKPSANPAWYISPEADPVRDMLKVYDRILGDYLALTRQGVRLMVATGLTQVPYDRVKYYYRLKEHARFLSLAGISCQRVLPRMTRDFEVFFDDNAQAQAAAEVLGAMRMERTGAVVFGEIERRERGLFATLTYPDEITPDDAILTGNGRIERFGELVAFVAIKNGMHSTRGFAFVSPDVQEALPAPPVHVAELFNLTQRLSTS